LRLTILAVGRMRDKRLESVCDEYLLRARKHLPCEVLEVEDDKALLRQWPGDEVIAMEAGGDAWDSATFARQIEQRMTQGSRGLTFVIGGSDGLPAEAVKRAQRRLSLSPLTLPHRLARVILCEQIYRALSIIRGEPYNR